LSDAAVHSPPRHADLSFYNVFFDGVSNLIISPMGAAYLLSNAFRANNVFIGRVMADEVCGVQPVNFVELTLRPERLKQTTVEG